MIGLLLTIPLVVLVPHGDDEITVLPEILAHPNPVVIVVTDGAATSHCPRLGIVDCEAERMRSTVGFMRAVAPHARVLFVGEPDGALEPLVMARLVWRIRMMWPEADLLAAGADYGHPDHDVVRATVLRFGGRAYDGTGWQDDGTVLPLVSEWYGWLGVAGRPRLGLIAKEEG